VSRYQKGKTNLDFIEARDSEWQWHQLGHMQVCTSLQTDNHASTPPLFLQAGRPSCRPTNSVKALRHHITSQNRSECGGQAKLTFDHADVVGAVADGERDALAMSLDEVDNERLLQRRDAAADDRLAARGRVQ